MQCNLKKDLVLVHYDAMPDLCMAIYLLPCKDFKYKFDSYSLYGMVRIINLDEKNCFKKVLWIQLEISHMIEQSKKVS